MPKRPVGGAFGCFLAKQRPRLISECKGGGGRLIPNVTKRAKAEWDQLSKEEQQVYEEEYQQKKEEYQQKKEEMVA